MDWQQRIRALNEALESHILVLDGAMGTMLHQQRLTATDGPALDGCMEYLVLSRPEAVLGVHRAYLEGGVDILLLETCNDTRSVKAGLIAIQQLKKELGRDIPVMVSGTIEASGT